MVQDITKAKDAEAALPVEERLRQSQAQLKTFIRDAPIAIAIFDRAMTYLATSNRWLAEFGRGHPDVIGKSHYEVIPDIPAKWKTVHQRGLAGATITNDEDLWVRADGVKLWRRWAVVPWRDETGAVGGIIISTEDVTVRKLAEDAATAAKVEAERREQLSRTMLNALPAAIAVLDRSGVITEVNDQWRRFALDNSAEPGSPARNTEIGVNYLDVCGQSVGDSADLAEDARQGILAVLDGRIPRFSLEYPCHSPDQRRWFTLSAVPLGQQDHAVLVSHTDVTALKQAEEDLLKLATEATLAEERERRAIAADLHDDLGQTLHVARIKLDSLAKALPPDAARERLVRDLRDLVADASRSVRSLTSQLNPSILNELGLVPALAWLADEIERVYGLVVTVEDDGAPKPLTFAQSVILFRAVRELLINVSKHARTDSAVVRLRTNDGVLRIAVRDEGIGMVDWRAAMAAHRGFGLASVRARIVSLNGGMDIEANLGDGTTVTLDMPLELSAPPSPEVPPC